LRLRLFRKQYCSARQEISKNSTRGRNLKRNIWVSMAMAESLFAERDYQAGLPVDGEKK
jgi:hypothetical protein